MKRFLGIIAFISLLFYLHCAGQKATKKQPVSQKETKIEKKAKEKIVIKKKTPPPYIKGPFKIREVSTDKYNEGGVILNIDRDKMYFHSDRPGGRGGYDIYYSVLFQGKWRKPEQPVGNLNTEHNEKNPGIAPDELKMYFASDRPGGKGGYDIWVSSLDEGMWNIAQNVKAINTPADEDSPENCVFKTHIFYTSTQNGNKDNWVTFFNYEKWQKPDLLGRENINGKYNDCDPSMSKSERIMVFASDRPGGYGKYDLYLAFRNVEAAHRGGEKSGSDWVWVMYDPINLSEFINSPANEYEPFLDVENSRIFFVSDRDGTDDIYFVEIDVFKYKEEYEKGNIK